MLQKETQINFFPMKSWLSEDMFLWNTGAMHNERLRSELSSCARAAKLDKDDYTNNFR